MPCQITLNLQDVTEAADFSSDVSSLFVRLELKNYGDQPPRLLGQHTLVPSFKDFFPDQNGMISGQIVGNDVIYPTNTYYTILYYSGGTCFYRCDTTITGTSVNLNSVTCLEQDQLPPQTLAPPPDDLVYIRLDAGNEAQIGLGDFEFPRLNNVVNAAVQPGSDIGAKINTAIATLGASGGIVFIPSGNYVLTTQVVRPEGITISIVGAGVDATIITAGSSFNTDMFFTTNLQTPSENSTSGNFNFLSLTLLGNNQSNCSGLHLCNVNFTVLRDLKVKNFGGTNSYGIWFDNTVSWSERNVLDHVETSYNTIGLGFTRHGGQNSFGYTRLLHYHSSDVQKGIYVDGGSSLYHSYIGAGFNIPSPNTAIWVESDASNNIWSLIFEGTGNAFHTNGVISGTGDVRGNAGPPTGTGLVAITQPEPGDGINTYWWNGNGSSFFDGTITCQTNWFAFSRADNPGTISSYFNGILASLGLYTDPPAGSSGFLVWLMGPTSFNDDRSSLRIITGTMASPTTAHNFGNNGTAFHAKAVNVGGTLGSSTGQLAIKSATATSGTAGSASALPTAPAGYLVWTLGGSTIKIPYYNS